MWFVGTYRVELLQPFNSKSMMVVFGGPKLPIIALKIGGIPNQEFEQISNHWENLGAKASKPLVWGSVFFFWSFLDYFLQWVRTMVTRPRLFWTPTVSSTKTGRLSPQLKKPTQPRPWTADWIWKLRNSGGDLVGLPWVWLLRWFGWPLGTCFCWLLALVALCWLFWDVGWGRWFCVTSILVM